MEIVRITAPTVDEQQIHLFNTRMHASFLGDLVPGRNYLVGRVRLAPAVTPDDYDELETRVVAVTGIQEAVAFIHGQWPASVPAGKELPLICEVKWFDDFFSETSRQVGREVMNLEQKFGALVMRVADAVTRADHAAMKLAVEDVQGIQACAFFADHNFAWATSARLSVDIHQRIDNAPEP